MKMNDDFLGSMKSAMHLLRTGGVQEASALIQRALAAQTTRASETPHTPTPGESFFREAIERVVERAHSETPSPAPFAHSTTELGNPGVFSTHTFSNDAGQRNYKLYVPAVYIGEPLPLVVMLHGCTQDADDFARGTRMNEMAEQHGLLVAYPNQAQSSNRSKCWNWFKPGDQQRDRGEPSLIAGMTREIIARYNVDARRVYVAGLSAGGAMAAIMVETFPDLYAAAAVHSGLPYACAKDLPSALAAMKGGRRLHHPLHEMLPARAQRPMIVFHGDADATVHSSNGAALVSTFEGTTAHSAARPAPGRRRSTVQRLTASHGIEAEYWLIHGAGHAWSGGNPRGSFTDPSGPDATAEMLRFFLTHPR
jgi:poly(hydroxyalkanoate) depolymerase family esterase